MNTTPVILTAPGKYVRSVRKLTIQRLIESRCQELGFSERDFIGRLGYSDRGKAKQRLTQLCHGSIHKGKGVVDKLPAALEISRKEVDQAVARSWEDIAAMIEDDFRATFKPHARVLTGEHGRPRGSLFIAAIINAGALLEIGFPEDMPPEQYDAYTLTVVGERRRKIEGIFYPITMIVVNVTPDLAREYDADGRLLGEKTKAYIITSFLWWGLKRNSNWPPLFG